MVADNAANPSLRPAANLCTFLQIMATSCGRLEGNQNPCRLGGSGRVIDRRVSVQAKLDTTVKVAAVPLNVTLVAS
jgi:hypothetical protein